MDKPRIRCEIRDGIAEVMLTLGDKLNALDRAMFGAIDETLNQLACHKGLRAVILHGEGRAFCAGLDVKSMLRQPVAALDILRREAVKNKPGRLTSLLRRSTMDVANFLRE